jgi:hypothetical protein
MADIDAKRDLPLARRMVIGKILSARTLEGCERANALIGEWLAVYPDDEEVASYGSFVARMESALRRVPGPQHHPEVTGSGDAT